MNERQIVALEKQFSVSLPNGYRCMLKDPPKLFAALLQFEEKESPGQSPLFLDPELIADANSMMRDPEHPAFFGFDPNDDSKPWPDRYFIIGSDVGGNFYCIAPSTKTSKVYFWHQGDTVLTRCADDMAGFVKRIFRSYGAVDAGDCQDDR